MYNLEHLRTAKPLAAIFRQITIRALFLFCLFGTLPIYCMQPHAGENITRKSIDKLNNKVKELWASNPDSVIALAQKAISQSEKIKYAKGQIEGLKNLGIAYYEKGQYAQSITAYQHAIDIFPDDLDDPKTKSNLRGNISLPLIMINSHKEALEHLHIALNIAEKHKLGSNKAHIIHNIGMLHNYQNNNQEALKNYRASLDLYEKLGDSTKSTFILGNIGHILLNQKDYSAAQKNYERSLMLAESFDNQKATINALSSMGNLKIQLKQYRQALTYLLDAKTLSEKTKEKTEYLRVLQNLSDCYKGLGQFSEAIHHAEACLHLATEQAQLHYIQVSSFMLAELYDATKDFQSASKYYKKSKLLTDSLSTVNSQNETVRLEEQFKYEKQREQVVIESKQQEQEWRIIMSASFVLVLALFLIILLMSRINKQRKRNLELEREKILLTEAKNNVLHKKNHYKNQLISTLGHDIKPPVENLKIMLNLLKDDFLDKEDRKRIAATYSEQLDSTISFLNNLLLWAIDQSETKSVQTKWVNLLSIFQELHDIYRLQLSHKNIALVIKIEPSIDILADEEMIKIVLRNLIHNALKFCSANDRITLSAEFDQDTSIAVVRVQDSGMGIPKNIQEKLLGEQDYSTIGTAGEKGNAFGLRLCKQYLQANETSLYLETLEGKGSTFWFTLTARKRTSEDVPDVV